jgi:hypothetical protein
LANQRIELKTDWNQNGIYSGILGLNTNLTLLKLATFREIQLCLIDFDGYNKEMVHFWATLCRILKGK